MNRNLVTDFGGSGTVLGCRPTGLEVTPPVDKRNLVTECGDKNGLGVLENADFPKEVTVTNDARIREYISDTDSQCGARLVYACASVTETTPDQLLDHDLPRFLHVPSLRPHQRKTAEAARVGRDVLLIAPTGKGKTEAFWAAGITLGGVALVVSPLRSLIGDHHRRATAIGLNCRRWNSDVPDKDKDETISKIRGGSWQGFLYTTPESLKRRELRESLIGRVRLAVTDEAHCCLRERSFRVSYAWLGDTLDEIGPEVRIACTATLPAVDRDKLIHTLHLDHPQIITMPVARDNLHIQIVERHEQVLIDILNHHRGKPGMIFTATVRTAEALYAKLTSQGRNVGIYNGRMAAKKKTESAKAFLCGDVPVMIATDAFLLGIDKPDIRFIVHYDYAKSIEDWVQGFGRAGRDGLPASIYGCFTGSREGKQSRGFLIDTTYPAIPDLHRVWEFLIQAVHRDMTAEQIGQAVLGNTGRFAGPSCIATLERHKLANAKPHPQDKRRRLYEGRGNFNEAVWSDYIAEGDDARMRFNQLCDLVRLPDADIPAAIDEYFGDFGRDADRSVRQ